MDKPYAALGKRLADLRGKVARKDFAERFNVSPTSLLRWEAGDNAPDLNFTIRLSSEFGISLEWIITGAGDKFSVRASDTKTGDSSQLLKAEPIENIEHDIKKVATVAGSADLLKEQEKELLTLYRENNQLVRENADLRAEVTRLQSQLAAAVGALGKSTAGVTSADVVGKAG